MRLDGWLKSTVIGGRQRSYATEGLSCYRNKMLAREPDTIEGGRTSTPLGTNARLAINESVGDDGVLDSDAIYPSCCR